jgi:hypothetical protein
MLEAVSALAAKPCAGAPAANPMRITERAGLAAAREDVCVTGALVSFKAAKLLSEVSLAW